MEVQRTADQEAFVRQEIERGDYRDSGEAMREALRVWEERERARAELRLALEESEADLQAGRYREYTDADLPELAAEIGDEARRESGPRIATASPAGPAEI